MNSLKAYVILIIFIIIISCKNSKKIIDEHVLLRIGDFSLSQLEFERTVEKLYKISPTLTKGELEIMVLDNFIATGLLIESAIKHNYLQKKEFKNKYNTNLKKEFRIRHNQYLRSNGNINQYSQYSKTLDYPADGLCVDYIRIPKNQKEIAEKMLFLFKTGASYSDIQNNTDFEKWKNLGLSFYERVPLNSTIFTKKIYNKISFLDENKVKFIKESASFYVIRLRNFCEGNPFYNKDSKILALNTMMAESLENGDSLFDKFFLENYIRSNMRLLFNIDVFIPYMDYDAYGKDEIIAKLNGHNIYANSIQQLITEMSSNVQSLFNNKSTRKKAIATLILISYSLDERDVYKKRVQQKSDFEQTVIKELTKIPPKDTVEFLKNWIVKNLHIYKSEAINQFSDNKENLLLNSEKSTNIHFMNGLYSFDDWLHPEKYIGSNELKLNYELIERLEFKKNNSNYNERVLAFSNKWIFKVEDFTNELDKLTPKTRLDIAKKNLAPDLIKYLSKNENTKLFIDYDLLEKIDIIGNSFDRVYYNVNENDTIGMLFKTTITVNKFRRLYNILPANIKKEFRIIDEDTHAHDIEKTKNARRKILNELLIDQFWMDIYGPETLKDDPEFIKEKKNCQNRILAEMYYQNAIEIPLIGVEDNKLYPKFTEAIKIINSDRLLTALFEATAYVPIEANINTLKSNYSIDISNSQFNGKITLLK